jgi:hypothetical protein
MVGCLQLEPHQRFTSIKLIQLEWSPKFDSLKKFTAKKVVVVIVSEVVCFELMLEQVRGR